MKRFLLLIILYPFLGSTQTRAEKKLGSWYIYHGTHHIKEKFLIITGFQIRTYETIDNNNISLGYIGVGYRTKSKIYTAISYGYFEIDRSIEFSNQPNAIEHRIMSDIAYNIPIKSHKIHQRIRLENRFIHFRNLDVLENRIRYRLGYQYPILKTVVFDINNEFFFRDQRKSYAENRFYFGFDIKTTKSVTLRLGYMKQYINELYLDRLQMGVFLRTGNN